MIEQWEVCHWDVDRTDSLERYLCNGWEPFAVTATRIDTGHGVPGLSEVIWLRRIKRDNETELL